jgi:hypothetical protein
VTFDDDADELAALRFQMLANELRIRAVLGGTPCSRAQVRRNVRFAVDAFLASIVPQDWRQTSTFHALERHQRPYVNGGNGELAR